MIKFLNRLLKNQDEFNFFKSGPTIGQNTYPKSSSCLKQRQNNNNYITTKSLKKKNNNNKNSKWKKDEKLDEKYIYAHLNTRN